MQDQDRVYIAGPMRGIPLYNFPAFDAAEQKLAAKGLRVFNPANRDREAGFDPATMPAGHNWHDLPKGMDLRRIASDDLASLMNCTAIYLLPGWQESKGARAEHAVARWLGLSVIFAEGQVKQASGRSILSEAESLTRGDRNADYGHPYDDYKRTADAFNALTGKDLTAADGVTFMACVKLSREMHRPKRDNRVDLAGYADCLDRIREREKELAG